MYIYVYMYVCIYKYIRFLPRSLDRSTHRKDCCDAPPAPML